MCWNKTSMVNFIKGLGRFCIAKEKERECASDWGIVNRDNKVIKKPNSLDFTWCLMSTGQDSDLCLDNIIA